MLTKIKCGNGNTETDTAIKAVLKSYHGLAPGAQFTGKAVIEIEYDFTRGFPFNKSIPQIACPWTLLSYALQLAGFQRERISEMVTTVMGMTDAERKEMRDSTSEAVESAMAVISQPTVKTIQGAHTFDSLKYNIETN